MAFTAPVTRATDFLVTAAVWNSEHVDNMNTAWPHLIVRKTVDESVTSSVTLQNDDVLLFPVVANAVWQFQIIALVVGAVAGGIKVAFTFPSGTFFASTATYNAAGTALVIGDQWSGSTSPTPAVDMYTPTTGILHQITGVHVCGGTGGNVVMQWAQQTSNATPTTVKAQSTLWGVQLA